MLIFSAFLLGLASNFHCLGMCGPIALAVPIRKQSKFISVFFYNSGRIFTYTCLGLIAGILGKQADFFNFQQELSIILGIIILVFSLILPYFFKSKIGINSFFFSQINFLKKQFQKQFKKRNLESIFILGFLNGLLPCGAVYLALAGALITKDWFYGLIYMAFFGIGTLPIMFAVPYFSHLIKNPIRQRINKIYPIFILFFGLLLILRGLNLGIPYISPKIKNNQKQIICH